MASARARRIVQVLMPAEDVKLGAEDGRGFLGSGLKPIPPHLRVLQLPIQHEQFPLVQLLRVAPVSSIPSVSGDFHEQVGQP